MNEIFENIESVRIIKRRWNVEVVIRQYDGSEKKFIASADSFFTSNDGIWFGTEEEYKEVGSGE